MLTVYVRQFSNQPHLFIGSHWQYKELIKSIPGARYRSGENGWSLPLTWTAVVTLRGVLGDLLELSDEVIAWGWEQRRHVDRMIAMRALTRPSGDLECQYELDDRLYPFQRVGSQFLIEGGSVLLGDEMGTGKTAQALCALKALHAAGEPALPALVICPNSVKGSWAREAAMWFSDAHPYVLGGTPTMKRKALDAATADPLALVIVNYEATWRHSALAQYGSMSLRRCRACDKLFGQERLSPNQCESHRRDLNFIPFAQVIVDEAHRIKDPHAKQTRAVWMLLHQDSVQRAWAMTGTPLATNPSDVWSILHGIRPDAFPTKTKFVERYCLMGWDSGGGAQILGLHPTTRDEFYRFFDPLFRRMPKALVLPQLPPKVHITRTVEMTPKQRKAYGEIQRQFLTWLSDGNVMTVANHLEKRVRLMQLASSFAEITYDVEDDWTTMHVKLIEPSQKIDELELVLDEIGDRSVVVAAESRQLIELASARLTKRGVAHCKIVGGMTTFERDDNLRAFQERQRRVMLMTIKAGGTGLTMTAADTIVFLQRSDSMVDNKQAEDRVHRIGSEQHESITVIDIVTADSLEVDQIRSIHEKLLRLDEITRDRKTYLENGLDTSELDREETSILTLNLGTLDRHVVR